ncbi:IS1595 family transposase [Clostridiaceae bacterium OttesenSCG-928-D20]|nr:IS1595 family transposase [Clostridiaceae bacterium OttesenSCG-928-D20]
MKNKYINRSKISESKFRQVVRLFSMDLTATQTAELTQLNRNTVNRLYSGMRERIYEYSLQTSPISGTVEIDESYFGSRRIRGKRGRGASGKTIVFGLFKRDGKVYTEIIPNVKAATLQDLIRGRVELDSVVHTDGWRGYDGLVDLGYEKHYRVNHSKNEFSKGSGNHINGIESFWGYAKHRLVKFNGIPSELFEIYLKETEFRFNNRGEDLYKVLLDLFRKNPLF